MRWKIKIYTNEFIKQEFYLRDNFSEEILKRVRKVY